MTRFWSGVVGAGGLVLATGCGASTRDAAILAANEAALAGDGAEATLASRYRAEELDCLGLAGDAEARACVRTVRVRYAPAWEAYEAFRAAWSVAATAATAPDGHPEAAVPAMVEAGKRLQAAVWALDGKGGGR